MHQIKKDNHYVPRSYLKHWADSGGRIYRYRVLVSHAKVPLWEQQSIGSLAYKEHLYTRLVAGQACDEVERWLDSEFECPAAEPLEKVRSNSRLTPSDWRRLILFLAAQDIRTPARLTESLRRWSETLPAIIDETLKDAVVKIERAHQEGRQLCPDRDPAADSIPGRLLIKPSSEGEGGLLGYEITPGRSLWLWSLKPLMSETSHALLNHKWTILTAPPGVEWLNSDSPVVRLNYKNQRDYDFGGGWNSQGTEIFMPLNPKHLMYTRIGSRPPKKGKVLTYELASYFQRFIAEHAHRFVFSCAPLNSVSAWKPRTVDSAAFKSEREQWRRWHKIQSDIEKRLERPG